jgi:hypothetical protein
VKSTRSLPRLLALASRQFISAPILSDNPTGETCENFVADGSGRFAARVMVALRLGAERGPIVAPPARHSTGRLLEASVQR